MSENLTDSQARAVGRLVRAKRTHDEAVRNLRLAEAELKQAREQIRREVPEIDALRDLPRDPRDD